MEYAPPYAPPIDMPVNGDRSDRHLISPWALDKGISAPSAASSLAFASAWRFSGLLASGGGQTGRDEVASPPGHLPRDAAFPYRTFGPG